MFFHSGAQSGQFPVEYSALKFNKRFNDVIMISVSDKSNQMSLHFSLWCTAFIIISYFCEVILLDYEGLRATQFSNCTQ